MNSRYVKFWLTENREGELISVRGWCEETETRYELTCDDDQHPTQWNAAVVINHETDDSWGFRTIAEGRLFHCMVATEQHALASVQDLHTYGSSED